MSEQFIVGPQSPCIGKRLDAAVSQELEAVSRTRAQSLIKSGGVLVNGRQAKPNRALELGDIVSVELGEPVSIDVAPEDIPLVVIYEDLDVIVVDKPKGMVVHPAPGHTSGTLVNGLLYRFGHELSGINGRIRPGIVHRIDKDTSGLLVVAKNDAAHQSLSIQLADHTVKREYEAVAVGSIPAGKGTVNRPIGRHPVHRKKMAVTPGGRHAVTHYSVVDRFERTTKYSYIRLRLETGRTHQIRVHMASIGYPILGDQVYGSANAPSWLAASGQVLHAKELGFSQPSTGEFLEFRAEMPEYFRHTLTKLGASIVKQLEK
ncbi:MAG: RluA family pseudouridine synthase [Defluviitaleaceae bacterium]|nr:RluA family pseudouridine synthase [Defluviitaleaceae bacterium]